MVMAMAMATDMAMVTAMVIMRKMAKRKRVETHFLSPKC